MSDAPTAPRILPVPVDWAPPPINILRTLAQNRGLAKGFLAPLVGYLANDGLLPLREREIVILRVGWRAGSEYEFGQHTSIGGAAGLTDEEIARLVDAGSGEWSDDDRTLVAMVDELCDDNLVSTETWATLATRWNDAELLELLVVAGFYRLVAGMLNSVGVALEPATAGWPDGASPTRVAPREPPATESDVDQSVAGAGSGDGGWLWAQQLAGLGPVVPDGGGGGLEAEVADRSSE
jgi:4-carboxymuconolactone decarboxylase